MRYRLHQRGLRNLGIRPAVPKLAVARAALLRAELHATPAPHKTAHAADEQAQISSTTSEAKHLTLSSVASRDFQVPLQSRVSYARIALPAATLAGW
jgi:hypothetical protein